MPGFLFLFSFAGVKSIPHTKFKADHFSALRHIPEPSGITYDQQTGTFYVVSDHGILFECDSSFRILREADEEGMDFEGVVIKDSFIYVSDESPRFVYKYRKRDLAFIKKYPVNWGDAMNKAFESITYNEVKRCFVLVSQQPVAIIEYDSNFHETERYSFHGARDISDAAWHNGVLYLLSNMDQCIFKCDPLTYEPLACYHVNVLNPEGLTFNDRGEVFITSDDLQRIYFFKNLPTIK